MHGSRCLVFEGKERPGILLFQDTDDPFSKEPAALHIVRPLMGRTLLQTGGDCPRQVIDNLANFPGPSTLEIFRLLGWSGT